MFDANGRHFPQCNQTLISNKFDYLSFYLELIIDSIYDNQNQLITSNINNDGSFYNINNNNDLKQIHNKLNEMMNTLNKLTIKVDIIEKIVNKNNDESKNDNDDTVEIIKMKQWLK